MTSYCLGLVNVIDQRRSHEAKPSVKYFNHFRFALASSIAVDKAKVTKIVPVAKGIEVVTVANGYKKFVRN